MSTTIFTLDRQGAAVALSGAGTPLRIGLDIKNSGGASLWSGMNVIMTGVSLRTQVNAQFTNTLRNNIYVYVFGEQLGDFSITGIAPSVFCGQITPTYHNLKEVHDFYGNNALSQGQVVTLNVFGYATKGYLVAMQMDYNKLSENIGTYTLAFKSVPPTAFV